MISARTGFSVGLARTCEASCAKMEGPMAQFLSEQPLLLLFLVLGLGYPLGRLRLFGTRLGVGAVLFVGLAFGALGPEVAAPEVLVQLGLMLFIYTLGLSSAPAFFASLRRSWLPNVLVLGVIALVGFGLLVLSRTHLLDRDAAVGLFAGALTNTPAMAAALDLGATSRTPVAYAIAYPMGILAPIVVLSIWGRKRGTAQAVGVIARALRIERLDAPTTIAEFQQRHGLRIVFGRIVHGGTTRVAGADSLLQSGDSCTVVGLPDAVARAESLLGSEVELPDGQSDLALRRLLVSSRAIAGRTLRELALPSRHNVIVTRISRGDIEWPATGDSVLLLGDRILVLGAPQDQETVAQEVGDSVRQLHELDVLALGVGLALGLLLGQVPVPLPQGTFKLGLAGGPLIAALLLGHVHRTGNIVWNLSFGANRTLRQFGLVLFLAGVGTRSGHSFWATLGTAEGPRLLAIGAGASLVSAMALVWGLRLVRLLPGYADGMVAGGHTQPAVLGFAVERHGNEDPNVGYSMVFPIATIAKVLLAQLLVLFG